MKRYSFWRDRIDGWKGWHALWIRPAYADIYPWWRPRRYSVSGWIPDGWYYLKCALWHRHNRLSIPTLPPTWNEWDDKMLHAVMAIFVDYYEVESPARWRVEDVTKAAAEAEANDPANYEDMLRIAKEEEAIYHWWTVERDKNHGDERTALDAWHERFTRNGGMKSEPTDNPHLNRLVFSGDDDQEQERLFGEHHRIEEANRLLDQSMLHRVIEIRESLWT